VFGGGGVGGWGERRVLFGCWGVGFGVLLATHNLSQAFLASFLPNNFSLRPLEGLKLSPSRAQTQNGWLKQEPTCASTNTKTRQILRRQVHYFLGKTSGKKTVDAIVNCQFGGGSGAANEEGFEPVKHTESNVLSREPSFPI